MSEKLYGVDQFYPGDFAPILTGVYNQEAIQVNNGIVRRSNRKSIVYYYSFHDLLDCRSTQTTPILFSRKIIAWVMQHLC